MALALKFDAVVIAVLSLDLLVQVTLMSFVNHFQHILTPLHSQFCWGKPGLYEIKNSVINAFDAFVENVCKWIRFKVFPRIVKSFEEDNELGKAKVNVQDYAVNVIQTWGEVFCGFGAYSIQEVFFCAG